jgi:glutamate synthase domain-containing protein 2
VSIGLERLRPDLMPGSPAGEGRPLRERIALWEDLLTLVVDPESAGVADRERKRATLSLLLRRVRIPEDRFWKLARGQRGRLFLSRYSRVSREIPNLEITSFDLDKLLKERFRQEPLTLGAAWHHGFWRSYFSHAAITHPANDGLREEFSTAWDLVRKHPAVLFRTAEGQRQIPLETVRLDLPMLVGPLPYGDGVTMERAWLDAIGAADPARDLHTRSLVVVEAGRCLAHLDPYLPRAKHVMPRLSPRDIAALAGGGAEAGELRALIAAVRVVELEWSDALATAAAAVRGANAGALLSVYLRYGGFPAGADGERPGFWSALEQAVRLDGVAAVQVHSGPEKSYRLIPRIDAFLKARFLRARVQLVSAGGDTDTLASAAAVYEAVLLGANGGAMTHAASLALLPELVDVLHGADPGPVTAALAGRDPGELETQALNTLTCWQHSILDFLSCMGIDDIQKTSGNTMAITMTEEWIREVDRLATPDFARLNLELNERRVAAEPVPLLVRESFRVSSLLFQIEPDLPLVHAARTLAHDNANFHLENSNRNLSADFLEVIYRMAAGQLPEADDFFLASDMGELSLDGIGVALTRESISWSLERLRNDPGALDYISLAVPRGFTRPGAVPPGAAVSLHAGPGEPALISFEADARGGFEITLPSDTAVASALETGASLWLVAHDVEGGEAKVELASPGEGATGHTIVRASRDGTVTLRRDPRGPFVLAGFGFREPIWHGPVSHASISLGAASEDFLIARIEGNSGLAMTSSGEGGPIRLASDEDMKWESLQAASGHFGIHAADLRRVRDVEIKINQGAKPGKGGRLSGAKVTPTVSRARNIPVGTDALSPDPKHDIYSIEDMPAEVWLWLLYHNHCGIKITGSNYTRYVAAGMWSNFVVDYLLVDSGLGGSGNYHADSSHVGWPDIFRTMLHTHHALVHEQVDLDGSGVLRPIRDLNGVPFGAGGGTRLFASGGLRGELDMLKVLIAGADGLVEASIGKAVAFGCNQCGNCHLDCPRGGITTKHELTMQNDRDLMRRRFRNWTALNLVKLAVLIDALNLEHGALDADGNQADPTRLIDDIRKLRGRTDLLLMPDHEARTRAAAGAAHGVATDTGEAAVLGPGGAAPAEVPHEIEAEHDSCRVGSLAVSEPVTVEAIWEAARLSYNGGNNRGGGIDFAGFAPGPLRDRTCLVINTIGPDRVEAMREILGHLDGCRFWDAGGGELNLIDVHDQLAQFRVPVRERYASPEGWRAAMLRENPGDFYTFFVDLDPQVLQRYGRALLASEHWLQRRTKYESIPQEVLEFALEHMPEPGNPDLERLAEFVDDVREEYFTALAHIVDSRYYRTHAPRPETIAAGRAAPPGKYARKRRGYVVSMGEDLAAIKISGWTHTIPEYFDLDRFWAEYPGVADGVEIKVKGRTSRTTALHAHVWGMHHRYPTNSPAIDAEGRGNPAGAHPFKAYNVLLMHNGEQVGVDSTSPFLNEFGYVHADPSMGEGHELYHGDSVYERKALTDTEYAAYLVDFTRRVLGLSTEEASQIVSPITGLDLAAMDEPRRAKLALLMTNYVQLTPTGPYKFTIVESRRGAANGAGPGRLVGFRENMDIKFLRPHEIIVTRDTAAGGVHAVANGSEAKIADSMLRRLHAQGVIGDAAADLRFSMRPGGNPGRGDFGGVFEAFTVPGSGTIGLANRFGEEVRVERAGRKAELATPIDEAVRRAAPEWKRTIQERLVQLEQALARETPPAGARWFGPDEPLPGPAADLVEVTLEQARSIGFDDYRALTERALPNLAARGEVHRAVAIRVLAELRKRLAFADLGGKALSSMEYLTDGGRAADGAPEGGLYRLLDGVAPIHEALAQPAPGAWRHARLTLATRDDLCAPNHPARDVLVIDFAGFRGESFKLDSASRILTKSVALGWRNIIGYDFTGGPRYVATNLASANGTPAAGVSIELFGREFGDFMGALLEGAELRVYGQAQSHFGLKADSGYLFVLQDALNTCMYAAHGGTISLWDSGSRFAAAGQNKVHLADGRTPAPGFKSIHFGTPNEYAFEYLMSGGENSLHVVMGLSKPDARGEIALRPKPYGGKFFMSGAAAGRVYVFDPGVKLDPAQYHGNVLSAIAPGEWGEELGPFVAREAARRGVPVRIEGEHITVRLEGEWRRWRYDEAFAKLIPLKVAKAAQEQGVVAPQLAQIVAE